GNDPTTGDYLVHFTVAAPDRGTVGNPSLWESQEPNDSLGQPQPIGVLFPLELQNTVTIERSAPALPQDTADYYQIDILQSENYLFVLSNPAGLPDDAAPTIWAGGVQQATLSQGAHGVTAHLDPGTYVIGVDWSAQPLADVSYQLN